MTIIEQTAKVGGQTDKELGEDRRPLVPILLSLLKLYWRGDKKRQAWTILSLVILFILMVAGINAYKTFLTKWVMNAIEAKDAVRIYRIMMIAVFSLILSTPLTVYRDYLVRYLQYAWRKWLNVDLLTQFFQSRNYYTMYLYSDIDNPDQRLAQCG